MWKAGTVSRAQILITLKVKLEASSLKMSLQFISITIIVANYSYNATSQNVATVAGCTATVGVADDVMASTQLLTFRRLLYTQTR